MSQTAAVAAATAVVATAVSFAVPELLAGAFTRDPAVVAEASRYLRIVAVSQLVVCGEVVLEGALGGAGATVAPMVASTTFTTLRIPVEAVASAAVAAMRDLLSPGAAPGPVRRAFAGGAIRTACGTGPAPWTPG